MIAIEYTDIIKRMTTTVIATAPMLLTISVILKWSAAVSAGVAAGVACQRTTSRLSAFVPRMLSRIVTVGPPRKVSYKLNLFYSRSWPPAFTGQRRDYYCATKL